MNIYMSLIVRSSNNNQMYFPYSIYKYNLLF